MTRHLTRFCDWEWPKTHTQLSTIWTLKSTDRLWPLSARWTTVTPEGAATGGRSEHHEIDIRQSGN